MKSLTQHINESFEQVNEASKDWTLSSTGNAEMYRFFGKTFPTITYLKDRNILVGRDDNGRNVSKSFEEAPTEDGLRKLISQLSSPGPSEKTIKEFLKRI